MCLMIKTDATVNIQVSTCTSFTVYERLCYSTPPSNPLEDLLSHHQLPIPDVCMEAEIEGIHIRLRMVKDNLPFLFSTPLVSSYHLF